MPVGIVEMSMHPMVHHAGTMKKTGEQTFKFKNLRMECLNHKYVYESPMKIGRLVAKIGDKAQKKTMEVGKRPYGVGLLVCNLLNN